VAVGVYTLAYQHGEGALELVSAPVASALLPRVVSEWTSGEHEKAWRTVRRGEAAVLGASAAALPVIFIADRLDLFRLISPNRHLPAIVAIISVAVGVQGTTKLSYGLLLAQGRPAAANLCFWQVVILSAVSVPIMTAAFGTVGTALATLLGYSALALLMDRAARHG
jgi:O-antigen/teichoic acid export membrane protein